MLTINTRTICLHELFEKQVDKFPDQTALISGNRSFSYRELDQAASQVSRVLRQAGVRAGDLTGLYMERSEWSVISILGILKAGAGYVPIDPGFPKDRASYIAGHTGFRHCLTHTSLEGKLPFQKKVKGISVDTIPRDTDFSRLSGEETGASSKNLCYVLYTSGSTGQPKGIMTEHRNVVSFALSFNESCRIQQQDRILHGFALGFDGSVEEMWLAFSNGATLVIGGQDTVRSGEDLSRLLKREKITVFSTVPTLLRTLSPDLPDLRLLILSGEPCPADLVKTWSLPFRRMLNVYGPTETTVNTTVAECFPDHPVTIGKALKGYSTWVLDKEGRQVASGESGELFIGGTGLSRGYLGRPDLTEKAFVRPPEELTGAPERLYRTGDLVRMNANNNLEFLGRLDHQVKIRGFRVEISEIESVLRRHPAVKSCVVHPREIRGRKELAAWVTTESRLNPESRNSVFLHLKKHLPAYMIPTWLDELKALPLLASGKTDRKNLPHPEQALRLSGGSSGTPEGKTERLLLKIWSEVLECSISSTGDDFFSDLGGYSLLAAEVVTRIRKNGFPGASLRQLYQNPTIKTFAKALEDQSGNSQQEITGQNPVWRGNTGFQKIFWQMMQYVGVALIYAWLSLPLGALIRLTFMYTQGEISSEIYGVLLALSLVAGYPLHLALIITGKWLIIGKIRAGSWPLWSGYFYRWWLTQKLLGLSGITLFAGTPVLNLYLRLLGSKIGKGTVLESVPQGAPDLLRIGSGSTVGSGSRLPCYRIHQGALETGTVELGSNCYVGSQSFLDLNTTMEDSSGLDDLSLLGEGKIIRKGLFMHGSPARAREWPLLPQGLPAGSGEFLPGTLHYLAAGFSVSLLGISQLPSITLLLTSYQGQGLAGFMAALLPAVLLSTGSYCLIIAAWRKILIPRPVTGEYSVASLTYLRKWNADLLVGISRSLLRPLYTTIFLPSWLRMLGARIGRLAEISTISRIAPELTEIGEGSFFADGSVICNHKIFKGRVSYSRTTVGNRSFVGNNALLPATRSLGNNSLIGCLSVPPHRSSPPADGSEWLGSPSFRLPHRKKAEGFSTAQTFAPTKAMILHRTLIDTFRIVIPGSIQLSSFSLFVFFIWQHMQTGGNWASFLLQTPFVALALTLASVLLVILIRQLVMGRFRPVIKPLWSPYVWLNEMINGAWESLAAPAMQPFMGTTAYPWLLRFMGCQTGKECWIETSLFSEFNLVHIGDRVCLNAGVIVQNHLFEDRIMKSSDLTIGNNCTVGSGSVILYDSVMEPGTVAGPLSLLMKGETIGGQVPWVGIPTAKAQD